MSADYVKGLCGVFLKLDLSERCEHPVDPANGHWRMCACCYEVFGHDDMQISECVKTLSLDGVEAP